MTTFSTDGQQALLGGWGRNGTALLLALLGVGLALGLIRFVPQGSSGYAALLLFVFAFPIGLGLPIFQCLSLLPRLMLILLALRPLADVVQLRHDPSSSFSLQTAYAVVILGFLLLSFKRLPHRYALWVVPNQYIVVLLGLSVVAWVIGGLSAGANGFARTAWGLSVALLLGPLFGAEKQIDVFVRAVFHSSIFVLLILGLHVGEGQYLGDFWRLGGQYGIPNTLAGVAFALFACGLYVLDLDRNGRGKLLNLSLLGLLAGVIILTQSQTVGILMVVSIGLWFWVHKRMRAVYLVAAPLMAAVVWLGGPLDWRLLSNLSLRTGEIDPSVLNLTGRTYLWTQTVQQYADASLLHKLIGLGWGNVFANFESFGFDLSSVTENSFLWFLVGTGIIGLIAFSAYLVWLLRRTWASLRHPLSEFERRLALLAFISTLTFLVEGFTTDLALSPVVNCYLYAILSIFVCRSLARTVDAGKVGALEA